MGRRGTRRRLARGIYEDKTGRAAIYRDGDGRQREARFPPHTTLETIRARIADLKQQTRGSGLPHSVRGSLADAVDRWDGLERHLASYLERRAELRAWVSLYGDRPLFGITREDIQRAISQWGSHGVAPKTIRNRLWTLRHLYHVLHGRNVSTPCDQVRPPAKTRTVPTWVSPERILSVYANLVEMERTGYLRDAKTRARFMVRASTGRRPCEIMRAQPDDVDLGQRTWRVRDAKGGWSEGLFLNDDMLIAWMTFAQADAWGPFNTGSMAEVLRHAGWPKGVRPYNLRHSAGIDLSERGIDLQDVGGWLGHTSIQTTRSAYVPILNSRMQRASQALAGRLSGWILAPDAGTPGKSTT